MSAGPSDRRGQLRALLGDLGAKPSAPAVSPPSPSSSASDPAPGPAPELAEKPAEATPGRVVSGSVKAMRLTLGDMGAKAAEAQALRAAIEAGESAVSLDPATIDASFVADRLGGDADDPDFQTFVEDIRAQGQLTPILVRPHPEREGRWQIAFGHRRWRAAKLLGRPVLAIARRLDDAALVIAQGQENAARRDLSFIEKAMFARTLEERGFSRPTLCAALSVHPSEAARLIGVARETPRELVAAIGPAPKAGRPRWMALAKALERDGALAQAMAALAHPDAARLDSDARFARAFAALREAPDGAPSTRSDEVLLADASGAALLRLSRPGGALRVEIDAARAPELARKIEALLRKEAARRAESG